MEILDGDNLLESLVQEDTSSLPEIVWVRPRVGIIFIN